MGKLTLMNILSILVMVQLVLVSGWNFPWAKKQTLKQQIKSLYEKVLDEQVKKDKDFRLLPLLQLEEMKGLFRSFIKMNIVDEKNSEKTVLIRKSIHIDDPNMFVTNFVLLAILETWESGDIELNKESLENAIKAILQFKDQNQPEDVLAYSFWKQDKHGDQWRASPHNLVKLIELAPNIPEKLKPFIEKQFGGIFAVIERVKEMKNAFNIPSDSDDSSVNVALGSFLKKLGNKIPQHINDLWFKQNYNIEGYLRLLQRHAYRPFLNLTSDSSLYSKHADQIDPRSYFVLAEYVSDVYQNAISQGNIPQLALAPTWLIDLDGELKFDPNVRIPFHTNNVDLSVNANVLYGLTLHFLITERGNAEKFSIIKDLYVDIAKFVKWAIHKGIVQARPDIALIYYPSKFDFYWFLARAYSVLKAEKSLPFKEMEEVYDILKDLLPNIATEQILDEQGQAAGKEEGGYWQEFLGNYEGVERGEDRLFATAVALNALLDIWGKSTNIPPRVAKSIEKGIAYLEKNIFSKSASKENAFFSGSLKTNSTFPFFYPATAAYYKNGTIIDPTTAGFNAISQELIYAFKGFTTYQQYQEMLKQKHFGLPLQEFTGFNVPGGMPFPFWSSPAITYSMTMLAFSKYEHLIH